MSAIKNPNHPVKGSSIKVEPIRNLSSIKNIKKRLKNRPRDLCLFVFGINTAYRANELVSISLGQVRHLKAGDRLDIKQSKNGEYRAISLNQSAIEVLHFWLQHHPNNCPEAPLICSLTKPYSAISPNRVHNLVKQWCKDIDLPGNYGSHSLRKTWGYHMRKTFNEPLVLISRAFGHSSEQETLEYLCIQPQEIEDLYKNCL